MKTRSTKALGSILALVLLCVPRVHAQQPPPDADWRTFRTEHFRVTFTPELERLARHAADVAERSHAVLRLELAPAPRGAIDLVVTDHVDFTNGYATPFPSNRIVVFARPPLDMPELAYTRDWIELVVAHELVHIFHLDDAGLLGRALRAVFGRVPFLWPLFPVVGTPGWNLEGLAVHYESRMTGAGRVLGSYHDMVARTAALEEEIPGLRDVSTPSPVWPGGQRDYIYGSLLMRWLADEYGADVHEALVRETATALLPTFLFFNRIAKDVTGRRFSQVYDDWRSATTHAARAVRDSLETIGITQTETVVDAAPYTMRPRVSPDGARVAYTAWDFRSVPATRVADVRTGAVETIARRNQFGGILGPASWLPDGAGFVVAQLEFRDPYRIHSDLWLVELDGDERRLTRDLRLSDPDVAPDGRRAVAVQSEAGALHLALVDLETGATRVLARARAGGGYATPRWSPDGRTIAAARYRDGRTDLVALDVETGLPTPLISDAALDAAPGWSPDGAWILFSSDRTGVPNLFAAPSPTSDTTTRPRLRQVTNVLTGAFGPEVSPDGRWLYFSAYHADGWRLERMPFAPAEWRDATPPVMAYESALLPPPAPSRADTMAAPAPESRPYRARASLRPYFWIPLYWTEGTAAGDTLPQKLAFFGATTFGWDVLDRHEYAATLGYDVDTRRFAGSLTWVWRGLGNPHITAHVARDWTRWGRLQTNDGLEPIYLREDEASLNAFLTRPRWRKTAFLGVGVDRVWHTLEAHAQSRDVLHAALDQAGVARPDGLWGIALRPGFANTHAQPYSISREDGISTSFAFRRWWRDDGFAHAYDQHQSRVAGYFGFPWWGFADHVLAGRISALARLGPDATPTSIGGAAGVAQDLVVTEFGGESLFLPVRGFSEGVRAGTRAWTASAEYRFPVFLRGRHGAFLGTSMTSLSAALFGDVGDAWCAADEKSRMPLSCDIEAAPVLLSAGAELSLDFGVLNDIPLRLRLGAAMPIRGAEDRKPVAYVRLGPSF